MTTRGTPYRSPACPERHVSDLGYFKGWTRREKTLPWKWAACGEAANRTSQKYLTSSTPVRQYSLQRSASPQRLGRGSTARTACAVHTSVHASCIQSQENPPTQGGPTHRSPGLRGSKEDLWLTPAHMLRALYVLTQMEDRTKCLIAKALENHRFSLPPRSRLFEVVPRDMELDGIRMSVHTVHPKPEQCVAAETASQQHQHYCFNCEP